MTSAPTEPCDLDRLRGLLVEALEEADRCDSLVAAHVATALELLNREPAFD